MQALAPTDHTVPLFYRFGPFTVDASRRLIFSAGLARAIPEKLFEVFLVLLEADGGTVDRDTFFTRIWSDERSSDANLTQHILMLRRFLREYGRAESFILTVSGKGYRLAFPVEKKIGLLMKQNCERCGRPLSADQAAYICSYECTYCEGCALFLQRRCMNCSGELQPRPTRKLRSVPPTNPTQ